MPYAAAGQARLGLLLACYAMFGLSLIASMIVTTLIWYRLTMHKGASALAVHTGLDVVAWMAVA